MHRQDELDFLTYLVTDSYALLEYRDVLKSYQFRDENCKQIFMLISNLTHQTGEVPTENECTWAIRHSVQAQNGDWSPLEVQAKVADITTVYNQDITKATAFRVQTWVAERDFDYLSVQMQATELGSLEKVKNSLQGYRKKLDKLDAFLNPLESHEIEFPLSPQAIQDIPNRLSRMFSDDVVPFPWDPINKICGGGGHKGEVSLLLGLPNRGKSTCLTNISLNAAELGYTVVHYCLDDSPLQMKGRVYAYTSGLSVQGMELNELAERVSINVGEEGNQRFILRTLPRASLSPAAMMRDLERIQVALEERGLPTTIDLVTVDYLDEMKAPDGSGKELRHRLNETTRELGRISGEMYCHVCVGTQSNAKGLGKAILGAQNLSEAFSKMYVPKLCLAICMTDSQMHQGVMNIGVFKNTWGPNNMLLPCSVSWEKQRVTAVPGAELRPILTDGGDELGGRQQSKRKPISERNKYANYSNTRHN